MNMFVSQVKKSKQKSIVQSTLSKLLQKEETIINRKTLWTPFLTYIIYIFKHILLYALVAETVARK